MGQKKEGKEFEALVAWIQKAAHPRAVVTPNDKLRDVDSGKLRQVDVSIRLRDGPTELLAIVEVRDRSRPIGVQYVEEVFGKRRSVAADAAFLVSKTGFNATAVAKAQKCQIRLFTYEQARQADWKIFSALSTLRGTLRKFDKPVLTFFDTEKKLIVPAADILAALKEKPDMPVIEDESGVRISNLKAAGETLINTIGDPLYANVPADGTRVRQKTLFDGKIDPPLFIRDDKGVRRRIGLVGIEADFFLEHFTAPVALTEMRKVGEPEPMAQVASAEVPFRGSTKVELLATKVDDGGHQLSVRFIPKQ